MPNDIMDWSKQTPREVIPGFVGRFLHSDTMTFALWEINAGAVLPPHSLGKSTLFQEISSTEFAFSADYSIVARYLTAASPPGGRARCAVLPWPGVFSPPVAPPFLYPL